MIDLYWLVHERKCCWNKEEQVLHLALCVINTFLIGNFYVVLYMLDPILLLSQS